MNILGVATFTGAANAVAASARALQSRGHSVYLVGKDEQARGPFRRSELKYNLLSDTQRTLDVIAREVNPDALLLGVSRQDYPGMRVLEHEIYDLLKNTIPSVAVLDIHGEYANRFSDYGRNDLKYLPDKVAVLDHLSKGEMMMQGISEDRIVVTGNPHFDSLRLPYTLKDVAATRSSLGLDNSFFVLYISDYLARAWGDSNDPNAHGIFGGHSLRWQNCLEKIGYNELTVLDSLTRFARSGRVCNGKRMSFLLKPHPREEKDICYLEMRTQGTSVKIFGRDTPKFNLDVYRLVAAADLVIGAYSTVLYESLVIDPRKSVISLQPNARYRHGSDLCVGVRMGAILPCYGTDIQALERVFYKTLHRDKDEQEKFVNFFIKLDGRAGDRVASLVESMI